MWIKIKKQMCLFHSKKRKMWLTMYNIRERERERVPPEIISLLLSFGCTRNHWIEIFEKSMVVLLWETMRSIEPKHWRPSKSNKGISFPSGLLCSSNWKKKTVTISTIYAYFILLYRKISTQWKEIFGEKKKAHTTTRKPTEHLTSLQIDYLFHYLCSYCWSTQ